MSSSSSKTGSNDDDKNGGGPCGACKFLRRKCVKGGCMFAPYFESDQIGTAHFGAVHKVFGASNASKLLLRLPPHKRLDAVVSLCYEALSRVGDPVYGCVAHIFTLQQQAELAYTRAKLSILQRLPLPPHQPQTPSVTNIQYSSMSKLQASNNSLTLSTCFDPSQSEQISFELEDDEGDLQRLAPEFVSKYLQGVRFRSLD